MKNLFSVLFLFFILTSAGGSSLFGQSNFLKQFESSIDIAQILSDTAANIDVVEIEGGGGNDTYVVNGNTEIRNRTFEAEIRRIRASENLDLLKLLNGSFVKVLKNHKFKYEEERSFSQGFNLRYSSPGVVGFVSVRGIYKENGGYFMSFIFSESISKEKPTRKK